MDTSAGDWLRSELDRKRITVRDAADSMGLRATQTIYAWMSGKAAPTDEAAANLAALLQIPEVEVRRRFGLWVPQQMSVSYPERFTQKIRDEIADFKHQLEHVDPSAPEVVREVIKSALAVEIQRRETQLRQLQVLEESPRERDTGT